MDLKHEIFTTREENMVNNGRDNHEKNICNKYVEWHVCMWRVRGNKELQNPIMNLKYYISEWQLSEIEVDKLPTKDNRRKYALKNILGLVRWEKAKGRPREKWLDSIKKDLKNMHA